MYMLPLVESLLTITSSHVVGCGNEQSTIQYTPSCWLLMEHVIGLLDLLVSGLPDLAKDHPTFTPRPYIHSSKLAHGTCYL